MYRNIFHNISGEYVLNKRLKFADMTVITIIECGLLMGLDIDKTKMCVDREGGTVGPCIGDLGDPLVIIDDDGEPTQLGISSYQYQYCESDNPAVFTRVTEYLDWIEIKTGITISP